ncbi:hemopexin [Polymixia lowei]
MKLLSKTFCLCVFLVFAHAAPMHHEDAMMADEDAHHLAQPDRCGGIEFDAITPDEKGTTFFFKGDHMWKGFHGPAQLSKESFKELDDFHHLGHVDAAFRMHNKENPQDHDHVYFLLNDRVFSYYNQTLEEGYPKEIQEDFPGVPSYLDAAVECPTGECVSDSVLFFKGSDIYSYDIATKTVKTKTWSHLPNCTSAFRWLEHYYCFHGHNFTRFHPVSGEVSGSYPKDARRYFMKCPNFGHGGNRTVQKCSEVSLDAVSSDDTGKTYFFKGPIYVRLDTHRDGIHYFPITRSWKEVTDGVDAVFSYADKIYFIKNDQVYIYKSAAHYTLIEGYPKNLKEELGIEGPVDAAFNCADEHIVHIIQGQKMVDIDLSATPRVVAKEVLLPIPNINAGLCGPDGVRLFKGSEYYQYDSTKTLGIATEPLKITSAMMGCQD